MAVLDRDALPAVNHPSDLGRDALGQQNHVILLASSVHRIMPIAFLGRFGLVYRRPEIDTSGHVAFEGPMP